jgi:signal transduction histidine kinase
MLVERSGANSRVNWHAWTPYLFPKLEETDSRFREEMQRLSATGLRVVAGVALGGCVFWFLAGFLWHPELLTVFGVTEGLIVSSFGLLILALSYRPLIQSRARLIGFIALYLLAVLDLWGAESVPASLAELGGFISSSFIMVMLVAVAAFPIKPVQMLVFGSLLTMSYMGVLLATGILAEQTGPASFAAFLILMTLFICIGLTAVIYRQRVSAYSARRAAEDSFEQLREAQVRVTVSENAASQRRFAAALSHDLNSPLGALASAFDTVVQVHRREQSHPEQRDRLESLFDEATRSGRQSTTRLKETIERMKRLSNLDQAEEQVVDLNELWTDTVALLHGELAEKVEVKLDLKPIPPLKCRPQQMSAVFSNLLRNAAAAIDEHGVILVSSDQRQGEVILEVKDGGTGIPAARLPHLFDPTFQNVGGRVSTTNWGFLVTRSIVMDHQGEFEIESNEGEGTTARIRLPLAGGEVTGSA